ncbi:MAG: STAS/SEC14 domain-containing protein [Deltaproteobacteria bacterium]|nr:STAS/SEC14 domain-containing protein [Deltaproteobacteria bacterium]
MLELLSENEGNILGLRAQGTITMEDFRQTLAPRLAAMIDDWGKARMLLYLEAGFQGFDLEAFKGEAFGAKHRDNLEKVAVVGGSFMINLQIRLGASLLGGEVQTFASEELEEAWDWVRG